MTPEKTLLRIAALQRRFINFDTDIKRLWKRASPSPQSYVGTPAAAEAPAITTLPPCSATCYYIWNIFSWSPYGSNLCASQWCVCSEPLTPGAFDGEIRAGSCSPPPTTTTAAPFPAYCGLISGTFTVRVSGFAGSVSGCGADIIDGTDSIACGDMILRNDGIRVKAFSRSIYSVAFDSFTCQPFSDTSVLLTVDSGAYVRVGLYTMVHVGSNNEDRGNRAYQISSGSLTPGVFVTMPLFYTYPFSEDISTYGTVEIKFYPS